MRPRDFSHVRERTCWEGLGVKRRNHLDMLRNKIQGLEATDPDVAQFDLAERRRRVRVRCYVRVQLQDGKQQAGAVVTDIGMEGVRLKTPLPLEPEQQVVLVYPDETQGNELGKVVCRTVWVKQARDQSIAGLTYSDTRENMRRSWVKYVLEELGFDEKRTFQRRKLIRAQGEVPARVFADQAFGGKVLNLGLGGALLQCDEPLAIGQEVELEICLWRILPALKLGCKVVASREEAPGGPRLHSMLFSGLAPEQIKLLGNYVIYLINQSGG